MLFRKQHLLITLVLAIAACTSQPETTPASSQSGASGLESEELLHGLFKNNGANALCDQPSYSSCFNISSFQCLNDIKPYSESCADQAKQQLSTSTDAYSKGKAYGEAYGSCMIFRHIALYSGNARGVSECIGKIQIDEQLMLKSLFGIDAAH